MQSTIDTFTSYKQARRLQQQANRLEERLGLLSRYGVERAQALRDATRSWATPSRYWVVYEGVREAA